MNSPHGNWRWICIIVILICGIVAGILFFETSRHAPADYAKYARHMQDTKVGNDPHLNLSDMAKLSPTAPLAIVTMVLSLASIGLLWFFTSSSRGQIDFGLDMIDESFMSERHPLELSPFAGLITFLGVGLGPILSQIVQHHASFGSDSPGFFHLYRGFLAAEAISCLVAVLIGAWMLLSGNDEH